MGESLGIFLHEYVFLCWFLFQMFSLFWYQENFNYARERVCFMSSRISPYGPQRVLFGTIFYLIVLSLLLLYYLCHLSIFLDPRIKGTIPTPNPHGTLNSSTTPNISITIAIINLFMAFSFL